MPPVSAGSPTLPERAAFRRVSETATGGCRRGLRVALAALCASGGFLAGAPAAPAAAATAARTAAVERARLANGDRAALVDKRDLYLETVPPDDLPSGNRRDRTDFAEQDAGYAVVIAISGADALEKAVTDKPDVIMMDINMPGLDGFATTRKLGQNPDTKAIPVIFVTSKDQKVDRAFAQMVGAKGYVTKPYLPEQILSQL